MINDHWRQVSGPRAPCLAGRLLAQWSRYYATAASPRTTTLAEGLVVTLPLACPSRLAAAITPCESVTRSRVLLVSRAASRRPSPAAVTAASNRRQSRPAHFQAHHIELDIDRVYWKEQSAAHLTIASTTVAIGPNEPRTARAGHDRESIQRSR